MNTCETCRWWTMPNDNKVYGSCLLAESTNGSPLFFNSDAYADDCESYKAKLKTKPNFGCVQWEVKP